MGDSGATTIATDVVDAFRETAGRHPHRPAIVHNGQSLSYARLDELVEHAARRLGRRPGVVGVSTSRTPATVVEMLGIWAAGGVYCPIDPAYPRERRDAMLSTVRTLDEEEDLAYILFTSGSTGTPKAVQTPRAAIAATVHSLQELFDLSPQDRVLQFASLNWDTCFEEILPTLAVGAGLIFHDEAYTGSFPRFLRMIAIEGITVLDLPTAFWHELVLHLVEDGARMPDCLRLLVIGGEAVNPARLVAWSTLDTGRIRLLNTYGCTETTLITHAVDLHGPYATRFDPDQPPIGRPLPHVVQRIGADGELLIGGPALALGYRGLPVETAARFVSVEGERFFRTGDRVACADDGTLIHQGRLDQEVKIRGIRVDPGEVEALIAGHPAVASVAVVATTMAGRTALVAYVVPKGPLDAAELLAHLRGRVAAHLVPSRVAIVGELSYTLSGKVDRAASHLRHKESVR